MDLKDVAQGQIHIIDQRPTVKTLEVCSYQSVREIRKDAMIEAVVILLFVAFVVTACISVTLGRIK